MSTSQDGVVSPPAKRRKTATQAIPVKDDDDDEKDDSKEKAVACVSKRRSAKDMKTQWVEGKREGLAQCGFCQQVFTANNGHGCAAKMFITHPLIIPDIKKAKKNSRKLGVSAAAGTALAPTSTVPTESLTYEAVVTRCIKRFFSGMLNQKDEHRKQFARRWILDKVEHQHRIRFMASLLMHAFVEFSCHSMNFANISTYMVCKTLTRKRKLEPSSEANETVPISDAFPTPLKVDQTIIHTALSLVCSTPSKTHTNKTTPLHMYFYNNFSKTKDASAFTKIQKEFGNGDQLHGTSLQYCARQMRTDFCSMMQKQLWSNTISWVRKELADIHPTLFTLFPARSVVVKAIMGWLFISILGEKVVLGKTLPPTDISSMETSFMECMHTKLKKPDYFSDKPHKRAWKHLWNDICSRFLFVIVNTLVPFERASAMQATALADKGKPPKAKTLAARAKESDAQEHEDVDADALLLDEAEENDDDDEENENSSNKARRAAKDYTACRRAEWLCALRKRLDELQTSAQSRYYDKYPRQAPSTGTVLSTTFKLNDGSNHRKKMPLPPRFKFSNVFPLVGYVPGSIMITEQLLQCMVYEYNIQVFEHQKNNNVKEDNNAKKAEKTDKPKRKNMHPHAWMEFFNEPEKYWKSFSRPGDTSSVLLRNKFTCDGISVSVIETYIETKMKYVPPVIDEKATVLLPDPPKLDYVNGLDIKSLKEHNIEVIITGDLNRKNYGVFHARKIGQFLDDEDAKEQKQQQSSVAASASASAQPTQSFESVNPFATLLDKDVSAGGIDRTDKKAFKNARKNPDIAGITITFSKTEYKSVRKIKQQAQLRKQLEDRERDKRFRALGSSYVDIFAIPPSLKGSCSNAIDDLLTFLGQDDGTGQCRFGALMFYYSKTIFRRLRMESYAASQQWWVYVQDKIYRTLHSRGWGDIENPRKKASHLEWINDPNSAIPQNVHGGTQSKDRTDSVWKASGVCERTEKNKILRPAAGRQQLPRALIVLGDGTFRHNSKGHLAMPAGHRLFTALRHLGEYIVWVDEFRTSMCCSSCGSEMEQAVIQKKPVETRGKRMGRITRRAKQDAAWVQKRIQKGISTIPSPLAPVYLPASSAFPAAALVQHVHTSDVTDVNVDFSPSVPFVPAFERLGRHRYAPVLSADRRVCRSSKMSRSTHTSVDAMVDEQNDTYIQERVLPLVSAYAKNELIESWGLRHCSSCNRLWCRDHGADRNMMSRTLWLLSQPRNEPTHVLQPQSSPSRCSVLSPAPVRRIAYKLDGPSYLCRGYRDTHQPTQALACATIPITETKVGTNPH